MIKKKISLSPINSIIKDARRGKMFILVDNKNRENEGDLVIPASKVNSKSINFMAKHGRGLICLALTKKQVDKLSLPLMSAVNKARMQTAFTVSIEAKKGITTGISAFDRAKTVKVAINENSKKKDIVSPGHVFPLVARNGGVLERARPCGDAYGSKRGQADNLASVHHTHRRYVRRCSNDDTASTQHIRTVRRERS